MENSSLDILPNNSFCVWQKKSHIGLKKKNEDKILFFWWTTAFKKFKALWTEFHSSLLNYLYWNGTDLDSALSGTPLIREHKCLWMLWIRQSLDIFRCGEAACLNN